MAAYIIFMREGAVRDPAEMAIYNKMVAENPLDPKLIPLSVYGGLESLEGSAADGIVLLQFPTMDDARAWYNSPAYQAASQHRKNGPPIPRKIAITPS